MAFYCYTNSIIHAITLKTCNYKLKKSIVIKQKTNHGIAKYRFLVMICQILNPSRKVRYKYKNIFIIILLFV